MDHLLTTTTSIGNYANELATSSRYDDTSTRLSSQAQKTSIGNYANELATGSRYDDTFTRLSSQAQKTSGSEASNYSYQDALENELPGVWNEDNQQCKIHENELDNWLKEFLSDDPDSNSGVTTQPSCHGLKAEVDSHGSVPNYLAEAALENIVAAGFQNPSSVQRDETVPDFATPTQIKQENSTVKISQRCESASTQSLSNEGQAEEPLPKKRGRPCKYDCTNAPSTSKKVEQNCLVSGDRHQKIEAKEKIARSFNNVEQDEVEESRESAKKKSKPSTSSASTSSLPSDLPLDVKEKRERSNKASAKSRANTKLKNKQMMEELERLEEEVKVLGERLMEIEPMVKHVEELCKQKAPSVEPKTVYVFLEPTQVVLEHKPEPFNYLSSY